MKNVLLLCVLGLIILLAVLVILLVHKRVAAARNLVLKLKGNTSTGYAWDYSVDRGTDVVSITHKYVIGRNSPPGTSGVFHYTIAGRASGEAVITFAYRCFRRGCEAEEPVNKLVYRVRVDKKRRVTLLDEGINWNQNV